MSRDIRDDFDDNRRDASPTPPARDRALTTDIGRWSPSDRLTLPRSSSRLRIVVDRSRFMLRDTEIDLLSTVGAFRAVQVSDLGTREASASERREHRTQADLRSLRDQGLLHRHSIVINGRPEHVAVLTEKGLDLLERSRADLHSASRSPHSASRSPHSAPRAQRFYSGLVKPRELAHNAQLYRVFETERRTLHAEGATITRVVLDDELKAEYHTYVYERQQAGMAAHEARRAFANEHTLSFAGEHIHFPDVRVEYQTEDGLREYRDLELATEHYSRAQVSGKQSAGFRVYRAAGADASARRGGAPADPHHLVWLS